MNNQMQYMGYSQPIYFIPELIAPNEQFVLIDDKVIEGIIPRYLVSNYGRVYDIYINRLSYLTYDRKGLKHDGTPKGYLYHQVGIRTKEGKVIYKRIRLSRTVAIMFNPVPNYKNLEVNHKSGDHSDNTIWNLEWSTTRENKIHSYNERIIPSGEDRKDTYITNEQADQVCQYLAKGIPSMEVSKITKVPYEIVRHICTRHSFRYISYNYSFPGEEKLPEDIVKEVCERLSNGETCESVYNNMRHYKNN